MQQYIVIDDPAEGQQTPIKRAGITEDTSLVPLAAGEILLAADLTSNKVGRLGTWQSIKPFRWYCGANWCKDDEGLHLHFYYVKKENGEYSFVITEAPFISQTYGKSSVTASLTIS